jgi:hypothetical protein
MSDVYRRKLQQQIELLQFIINDVPLDDFYIALLQDLQTTLRGVLANEPAVDDD